MKIPKLQTVDGRERRTIQTELRVAGGDGQPTRLEGYPAVFNSLSMDLGGFRERILPGAFTRTLQDADVRALFNHDVNFVLGRTKSGTLSLQEDERGLAMVNTPPDTQLVRDMVIAPVKRGDVDQMSFMFRTRKDKWLEENGWLVRELVDVDLFDVSPVTFPAYPATVVSARDGLIDAGIDYDALVMAISRTREGQGTAEDRARIESAIEVLHGFIRQGAPAGQGAGSGAGGPQGRFVRERRLLDLLEQG